ncbi:MAG: hypothetical protein U9P38_01540 [Campylobacterota bacterium]|nr:hypothetical protein [Campylobacterota bacterium]
MILKIVISTFILLLYTGCIGKKPSLDKDAKYGQYGIELTSHQKLTILINSLLKEEFQGMQPTFPLKPKQVVFPKTQNLIKGEYEKTTDFQARVESVRKERVKSIELIKTNYHNEVDTYNNHVKELIAIHNSEISQKKENIKNIRYRTVIMAYNTIYEKLYIDKNLKYDADNEYFIATLKSTKGEFSEKVTISVPIEEAQLFKQNIDSLEIKLLFEYYKQVITLKTIYIMQDDINYETTPIQKKYKTAPIYIDNYDGSLLIESELLIK